MIAGIGTDLITVERMERIWQRHGERLAAHILSPEEQHEFASGQRGVHEPARWLAKRWAAKEAFGKAAGTGMRAPVKWSAITVVHDALGRPSFTFAPFLKAWLHRQGIDRTHLSISDEHDIACAFVVIERNDSNNAVA
jgi:holo-[acyl-carrier protein] synthase